MELNEKQLEMCTANRWDFSDLRAIFLNCTLKKSPEMSHTEGPLADLQGDLREERSSGRRVEGHRSPGRLRCLGRHDRARLPARRLASDLHAGQGRDHRRHRLLDLARREDVCVHDAHRAALRQLTPAERARPVCADYGKVDGCLITGNEDGAKHCSMNILYSLSHLGYVIPPQADSGWLGPVGPGPSYLDPGSGGPERLHQPQHDVHDVEPHAPRPHDQGHWRHPGPRQPTVEVGCGMSLRLSQPRAPLAVCGESAAACDRRCIPPGGVVPRSQTAGTFPRRALQEPGATSLRTGLDATLGSPRTASASPRPSHFRS